MARYQQVKPEEMTPEQRRVFDKIAAGPRGSAQRGPFMAWLPSPKFADLAQALGAQTRFGSSLPAKHYEIAILMVAQQWRAQFEWYAHEPMALKAGVLAKTVRDLKAGRVPKSAPKDERALYDFIQELYRTRRVSDRTYKKVSAFLNDEAIVELVGVLGYYTLISMTLNVFQMLPPPEAELAFAEP